MRFTRDFPDILRANILPSQVISKRVKLKKNGKEYQGLCPFHNEKTPSFTVNDQKGFYHCFGCGAHGDIISFLINNEGLDFKDAVIKLANDFSIAIPQEKNFSQEKEDKIKVDFRILEEICCYYQENLFDPKHQNIRDYLKNRHIKGKIAQKFRLGYALDSYDSLVKFLQQKDYQEDEILRTGVVAKNQKGSLYDKLRHRIIFPITNKNNQVIAFGGRVLNKEIMPKYLNSAETSLFIKKRTLYNFANARSAIFKEESAIIVEGYMDVIALNNNGVENVVAGLGTALGEQHILQLFAICDKIIVCLDGDKAGFLAAQRLLDIALPISNNNKNLFFAFLPNDLDPDDFISKFGKIAFKEFLNEAKPMSQAMIDFAMNEIGINQGSNLTAEDKAKLEGYLQKKANLIKDPLTKKYFLQFFKDYIYKIGRFSYSGINKNKNGFRSNKYFQLNQNKDKANLSDFLAQNIICYIIKKPELVDYKDENFTIIDLHFDNDVLNDIKDRLIEIIDLQNDLTEDKILLELEKGSQEKRDLEKNAFDNHISLIKDLLSRINIEEHYLLRFRILLLKELLLKVDLQYKDCLTRVEEIKTDHSSIENQKIRQLFDYKSDLENEINNLEQEII